MNVVFLEKKLLSNFKVRIKNEIEYFLVKIKMKFVFVTHTFYVALNFIIIKSVMGKMFS